MYKGSLITIEDLSNGQMEDILDLAQDIEENRDAFHGLASRRIMASLFLEPSTRTRGSFEAAMKRLGGDTITVADPKSASTEKGESLADTIRVWGGYSDLIALRHPWEGAARLAAEYSDVPVINAGDGSHEHPTQTLLDIYTLRKELGTLAGRKIVLCGDLLNGRTIHSLIYALLRFGADIIYAPGEGLELPDHVLHKIDTEYNRPFQRVRHSGLEALYRGGTDESGPEVDVIYMTPSQPHSLTLIDSIQMEIQIDKEESLAFYVTRKQVEREGAAEDGSGKRYPRMNAKVLQEIGFSNAVIMHPLPRVDEIPPTMDSDPRSKYFEQARNGVPIRMALIALMLGLKPWKHGPEERACASGELAVSNPRGIVCLNQNCVAQREPQNTKAEFTFFDRPSKRFVCCYCERETFPAFYAHPNGEVYYSIEKSLSQPVDPSRGTFFLDEASALASNFRPSRKMAGSV